jgi:predicted Zn-dependent protease
MAILSVMCMALSGFVLRSRKTRPGMPALKWMPLRPALWVLALLLCLCLPITASGAFTIEDENKVGREFYDKLAKHGYLEQNQKAAGYLARVGNLVLANSRKAPFDFHFFIVKSAAVNAFATPGGYVYINTGLINLVETEAELAGVLAHEIAHANARHIAAILDKSQKVSIASLAAILAGALFGGGGQGTAAIAALSMATATHLTLQYSREHEEEADRLGIAYLVQSGYDGKAMLDFLRIMRRYEFYSNTVPSYFLTHPGTDERIRYLDGLLHTTYRQRGKGALVGGLKRIQAMLVLENKNLDNVLREYQQALKKNPDDVDMIFGLALVQEKLGLLPQSLENFQRALKLAPADEDILLHTGVSCFKAGRPAEAIELLQKALFLNEGNEEALIFLAKSYETQGDFESTLKIYSRLNPEKIVDEDIYYNMAVAYGRTGDRGNSHYHFGVYFKKKKKRESALFHFQAALPHFPKDSERARSIEKEIISLNKAEAKSPADRPAADPVPSSRSQDKSFPG